MRYRLRTLLILLAVLPPVFWLMWNGFWFAYDPLPIKGGDRPVRVWVVLETLLPALYVAAWILLILVWRWDNRSQPA